MRTRRDDATALLSVEEGRARILDAVRPPGVISLEHVPLERAAGRVLGNDLVAGISMPRWPNSAMDGYALRVADVDDDGLPISQRIVAGATPSPLQPGTAARILTGARLPAGADTVVVQEHCRISDGLVFVESCPESGSNIRESGGDFLEGDHILTSGCHLRAQHIALAASSGATTLAVLPRLRVALLITGDELVQPGHHLGESQIYQSNGHMLSVLAKNLGAEVESVVNVPDCMDATRDALLDAAGCADVIMTCGGASVGDRDYVRAATEEIGELTLFGIAVKPGKPLASGHIHAKPILMLPGNPASLFVTFLLFGAPLMRRLQQREMSMPDALWIPAGFERTRSHSRADYIRVRLHRGTAVPCGEQNSGLLTPTASADGVACIPPHTKITVGEPLAYYPFSMLLD